MKNLLILFTLITLQSYSQTITYENFKQIIPHLQNEDWSEAFKTSELLLKNAPQDTSEFKAITVYINIFSGAGMVADGKMTQEELQSKIMQFEGQKIIMAAHPVKKENSSALNTTALTPTAAFTNAANLKGFNILCFEKTYFKEEINVADFTDVMVRCGGVLDKIEFNSNESKLWIARLTLKDGFVRKAN